MWKHVKHAKKQCTTLHSILITLHSVEEHWIEEFKQANDKTKTKTRRRTKYVVWEKITVKCHQIHFPFIRSFTGTCNNKFWPTSDRKRECPALLKLNKQIWTHCKCIAQYHNLSIMSRVCSELLDWARKRENGYFGNEFQKDLKTFLNPFSPFLHKIFLAKRTSNSICNELFNVQTGECANRMQHLQSLNYNYKSISDLFQNPAYNANITRV